VCSTRLHFHNPFFSLWSAEDVADLPTLTQRNGFTTVKAPQTTTVVLKPVPRIHLHAVLSCFLLAQPTPSGFWSAEEEEWCREEQAIYGRIKGDTPEMGKNRRAIVKRNESDGKRGPVPQVLSNWWRNGAFPSLVVIGDEGSQRKWQILDQRCRICFLALENGKIVLFYSVRTKCM
jgi:hypothetical protein